MNNDFSKIPKLRKGSVTPPFNFISDTEKLIKETELKNQRKHDYKVAFFSIIGGGIMGLITSIVFWLITK